MDIFIAMLLGAVQGLTEFLPVSSSGHLTLLQNLFGIDAEANLMFTILMHVATLLAVVFVFYKQIWFVIKNPLKPFSMMLLTATLITVVMVIVFKPVIDGALGGSFLAVSFFFTAILLLVTTLIKSKKSDSINFKTAIIMGVAQGIAVLPGVSRSGSTICGGLLCGADRAEVANFSFLLSVPIIVASFAFSLISVADGAMQPIQFMPALVGFASAFVFGLFAIKFMLKVIKKGNYLPFAIYLFVLSALLFIFN